MTTSASQFSPAAPDCRTRFPLRFPLAILLAAGGTLALSQLAVAAADEMAVLGQPPAAAQTALAARAAAVDALPLRKVTLYRSGVGAFVRQGSVQDTAKIGLKFDVTQINDVLKSLQVLDRSGGRVDSVTYGSKDPLSRRLSSFALQIGDNPSVSTILERLRGAQVTLVTGDRTISGTVLSTEIRKVVDGAGAGSAVVDVPHVNILTGQGVRSIAIRNVTDLKIDDAQLADDLQRALAAMAESRAERVKTVDFTLSGTGARDIVIGYIHETPVWKTSYRLVLPEAKEKPAGDAAANSAPPVAPNPAGVLQGWAIVENTTDQDWSDVRLSLVSGRPISFRMDLYEPLYAARPEVPVPMVAGVSPRTYEGTVTRPASAMGAGSSPLSVGLNKQVERGRLSTPNRENYQNLRGGAGSSDASAAAMAEPTVEDMLNYAPAAQAQGQEIGEVFAFSLENPVTIERQRSAMIPFLTAAVGGRRLSIFNPVDGSRNPLRGVEIINNSNLPLLPGPISVFDGSAYAGDAQIAQIVPGEKRLLTYAVDLEVTVTSRIEQEGTTVSLKFVDGLFFETVKQRRSTVFLVDNKDQRRGRTVLIELPKLEGWTLVDGKPEQETATLLRFAAAPEAGKSQELTITYERTDRTNIGIDSYDRSALLRLRTSGKVSDAVLAALGKISAKQSEMNANQREIEQADGRLGTLRPEQTRIASMMEKVDKTSDTYRNLLSKLNRQEGEIDTLTASRLKFFEQSEVLRKQYEDMIRGLSVD